MTLEEGSSLYTEKVKIKIISHEREWMEYGGSLESGRRHSSLKQEGTHIGQNKSGYLEIKNINSEELS